MPRKFILHLYNAKKLLITYKKIRPMNNQVIYPFSISHEFINFSD